MRIVAMWALLLAFGPAMGQLLPAPTWNYQVVGQRPHDTSAFTEGLLVHDDQLIESTGLYGHSVLSVRDFATNKLRRSITLPSGEFGEGTAVAGRRLFQLTWREQLCHVYDLDLHRIADFHYSGEGWGLTFDGHQLIRSDGSATLHFHNPADFSEVRQLTVRDADRPINLLNELEWIEGRLYANVWMTDRIAVIDPFNGLVLAWLDLGALKQGFPLPATWDPRDDVLNGIAYQPKTGHLLVTGKRWPVIFEIAVEPLAP